MGSRVRILLEARFCLNLNDASYCIELFMFTLLPCPDMTEILLKMMLNPKPSIHSNDTVLATVMSVFVLLHFYKIHI